MTTQQSDNDQPASRGASRPRLRGTASSAEIQKSLEGTQLAPGTIERSGGRIMKVFAFDPTTGLAVGEFPSKQILDPFLGVAGYGQTIRIPPLDMEQLVLLAEAHPIHAAAIEQKVSDIVADGLDFVPIGDDADEDQKADMLKWWEELFEEFTSLETIQAVDNDFETVGWGALEIARDVNGIVRRLYHVPGHTLRAHTSNLLYAQIRMGRVAWFKAWGVEDDFLVATGQRVGQRTIGRDRIANEILIFRKLSRRSFWYGIPVYVSGIGHLAMAIAARDFNIKFFDNYREPRHLIIISGLADEVDQAMDDIETIWQQQLKDQPHHNVVIPIAGDAQINVVRMGLPINDMHFARLMEQVDGEILVAHRMPPDRVGVAKRGSLGGNITVALNTIYKDGVVAKGQAVLESRLQRFISKEYALSRKLDPQTIKYEVSFEELDISDEQMDVAIGVQLASSNLFTLNEVRERLGHERHEPFSEMTLAEYLSTFATAPAAFAAGSLQGSLAAVAQGRINAEVSNRLADIDGFISDLLSEGGGRLDEELSRNGAKVPTGTAAE